MNKTVSVYNIGVGNIELLAKKIGYWQNQGLKIKMTCPKYAVPKFKELIDGIEYIEIPFCRQVGNKFILIFEFLKRFLISCCFISQIAQTDVLYSISSVLNEILLPFFVKLFNKKIVWVALFENEVPLKRPGNFLIRILAWIFYQISFLFLRTTDKIFAVSENLKLALIKKGFDIEKIVVTGNAIDRSEIEKAISQKEFWFDGLFVGRIEKAKGVFDLIKIGQGVVKEYPDFKLGIVGSGDIRIEEKLKRMTKDLGLEKNIKFFGYVSGPQKFRLLANSRIFLFPSHDESFGVALLEAVCSGIKTIAYDLPAYKNIYLNNELIAIPLGDIDSFSEKVISILNIKDFANPNGLKLLVSEEYSYERIAGLESDNFEK
ncbi:MAG: Glycosyltransferase, family 4 [Parcubacteria group bacterium GW2011_GWC2_39_11]|nr:MAG: Glycosyltransferase, family 4 [Parcubacteria group bacterium GW2011_GWC2_39_11]